MALISDFSSDIIDQIVSTRDTSYATIKLWLCGNKKLNAKLSNGISLIELRGHPFGSCRFPRIVLELRKLRHLSIFSVDSLVENQFEWPKIIRSLPNTLESLAIYSHEDVDCLMNFREEATSRDIRHLTPAHRPQPGLSKSKSAMIRRYDPKWSHSEPLLGTQIVWTVYPRGESEFIELETLFPRLHTLTLDTNPLSYEPIYEVSSDLFVVLPTSLTRLDVPIHLEYDKSNTTVLARLPPNIIFVKESSSPNRIAGVTPTEASDVIRRDLANAPTSLQSFRHSSDLELESSECWLPKSLLEVKWSDRDLHLSPSVARTMPPNVHTLSIRHINTESYENTHTNWVADIPRSVAALTIENPFTEQTADFDAFIGFLPPNLTLLNLDGPWIEPDVLPHLPQTLKTLVVSVSSSIEAQNEDDISWLSPSVLPPSITDLTLKWTEKVSFEFTFGELQLAHCSLLLENDESDDPFTLMLRPTDVYSFPSSLTVLRLIHLGIEPFEEGEHPPTTELLPKLEHLVADAISFEMIKLLPKGLESLDVGTIIDCPPSLFQLLPPALKTLHISTEESEDFDAFNQDFESLPSLNSFSTPQSLPSSILRKLPRTLKHLRIDISEWDENDFPFIPPHLMTWRTVTVTELTPLVVKHMPLRVLAQQDLVGESEEVLEIVKQRVLQASKAQ